MTYDDWKTEPSPVEDSTNECAFCGNEIDDDKDFCSKNCMDAYFKELG